MKWKRPAPLEGAATPEEPAPGEAAWLCPGWEVPAGFCTADEGPSATETSLEDRIAGVAKACRRLNALVGLEEATAWAFLHQVHGVAIQRAEGLGPGEACCLGEADGVWTEQPGLALAVQTADCVPLLFWDSRRRRVAAVHAGWRGIWGRIVWQQLQAWFQAGSRPGDIAVALGPCIGPCCYEVSEELAQPFAQRWGEAVVCKTRGAPRPFLDLAKALELDLLYAGVLPEKLQYARVCTFCDVRFHSFRRAQGRAGRQLSWIGA